MNSHSSFLIPHSLILALFISSPLFAGNITGKALFDGAPGENPKIDMSADPVCKSLNPQTAVQERIVINPNGTLKNVFVYVKEGISQEFPVPSAPAVLDQQACTYHPRIQGMQANQKLQIINSDATLHNVHAFAKNSPEFNLGMPMKGMKLEKTFSNSEVMVKMKCDVHPWMAGYIGVLKHPFFAVTDEQGTFKIENLPPGEYTVEAWHETYGTKTQKITVADEAPQTGDFKFSSKEIVDEASGLTIKTGAPLSLPSPLRGEGKGEGEFDDSAALNVPRPKTGWWLPANISTYGRDIDQLFYLILGITGFIFIGVQAALLYFLFRYRAREGVKATYTHGNKRLEIIWTAIPAVILIFLTIWSQRIWSEIKGSEPPMGAIPIQIQAEQFAWNIQYPGLDGKFGTPDDVKTINQLHIPVGRPVRARLTSIGKDGKHPVIHSFFLPEFRLKQDVVPGMQIDVWFQATRTGKYEIACAEFCGLGHYRMRGFLSIHSPEGYEAWLKEQA
ncbi:MAG: cytochrome c oxidase subunit II [Candidatus Omnitrophica bacterium]|nr:cytochrome c oxidase subunit II [Candidatus Omnitrophota bacterium]